MRFTRHWRALALVMLALVAAVAAAPAMAAISGTGSARLQIRFVAEDVPVATRIVRAGDTIEPPDAPSARQTGWSFSKWAHVVTTPDFRVVDLAPYAGHPLTDAELQDLIDQTQATPGANNLYDTEMQAIYDDAFSVRLHQYPFEVGKADPAKAGVFCFSDYTTLVDGHHTFDLAQVSQGFVPISDDAEAQLVAWEAYAPGASAGDAPVATYDAEKSLSDVGSDLELYPKLAGGFWVTLDTQGAGLLESVFVQNVGDGTGTLAFDRLPTEQTLAGDFYDPTTGTYSDAYRGWNQGYRLEGWYEDAECTTRVAGDLTITSAKTLHAKWDPRNDTPYSVVHMVEGEDNGPGYGTYTMYASEIQYGTTGQIVTGQVASGISTSSATIKGDGYHIPLGGQSNPENDDRGPGFGLNHQETTIDGAGRTLVRVYWNRDRWSVRFNGNGLNYARPQGQTDLYGYWVKWGESSAIWDPNRVVWNKQTAQNGGKTYYERKADPEFYVLRATTEDADGSRWFVFPRCKKVANGSTVTMTYYNGGTPSNTPTRVWVYRELLEGGTPVTLNGETHYFDEPMEIVGRTNLSYVPIGYERDGGAYLGWAYKRYGGDLTAWPSNHATLQVNSKNGSTFEGSAYYLRRRASITFANCDQLIGREQPRDAESVMYGEALSTYDPGFDENTMRMVGNGAYRFVGWYSDSFAAQHPDDEASAAYLVDLQNGLMPANDFALYAGWRVANFDVTFDAHGGTFPEAGEGTLSDDGHTLTYAARQSGTLVARPPAPSRVEGSTEYVFGGWYKDAALTQPFNFYTDTVGSSDVTIHAKWLNNNPYTVTYHTSEGEVIEHVDDTLYRFGSTVAVAGAPEGGADGFLGWSRVRGNVTRIVGQTLTIASDTDLFAVYGDALPDALPTDTEDGAPRVTLVSNYANVPDGTMPLTDELSCDLQARRANDTVALPSQLTATVDGASVTAGVSACRLAGWNTAANGRGASYAAGDIVAVESDTTLYAQWEPNRFAVDPVAARTYDGSAHEPAPAVRDAADDTVLVRDRDYELAWEGNLHAGTAAVTVTGLGDYAAAPPVRREFAIGPARVTLAADDKSTAFGEGPAPLTWRPSSGSIAAGDDLGVTLSCDVTAESAVGTYPIAVAAAGSGDYEVTLANGTYTVVPDTDVAVQVSGYSGTYDGAPHGITVAPEPRGDTAVTVYYAREELTAENYATAGRTDQSEVAPSQAGEATVWWWLVATGDQTDSKGGSATVSLAKAPLACAAADHSVTYGDGPGNAGVSWSGFVGGDGEGAVDATGLSFSYNARPDGSGAPYEAGSPRGSYYIIPSGATSANYDVSYAAGTLSVSARELGVSWSAGEFAYTGTPRHYDGATLTGLVAGDEGRVRVGGYAGTPTATDAGAYTASVSSLTGEAARNYLLPANGHEWRITQAPNSLTVAIDGWAYGGAPNVPVITAGFGGDTARVEWAASAEGPFSEALPAGAGGAFPDVGTYYVRAGIDETPNWQGATSRPVAFSVSPAPLVAAADDLTVAYGSAVPAYTATWTGFAAGESPETPTAVTGELALACDYAPTSPVGSYAIEPSGPVASANYALTLRSGTLTVEPADLSAARADMAGASSVLNAASIAPAPASVTLDGAAAARPGGVLAAGVDYAVRYRRAGSPDLVDAIDAPGAWQLVVVPASGNFAGELAVDLDVAYATYQVAYDANLPAGASHGAEGMPEGPATWTFGAPNANALAPAPSLVGWDFDGWATSATGGPAYEAGASTADDFVAAPDPEGSSAATLYARWSPHETAVTLDAPDATEPGTPAVTASYDADMPAATMPARTGYDFAGMWLAGPGGAVRYYEPDGRSSRPWDVDERTATLEARWTAGQYIVALEAPGATVMGDTSVTATYDADMPAAAMPARTGYDFAGYWDEGTGTCYYAADGRSAHAWDVASNGVTLRARWAARATAVSFDAGGGTGAPSGVTATFDQPVPAIDRVPTRAGHTLLGIFAAPEGEATQYYAADGTPVATWDVDAPSATLFARWSPRAYPVTFESELSQVTGGSFDTDLLTYADPAVTRGSADFGGRAGAVASAPVDVTQTIDGGTIAHHLIGWTYSYTGADGLAHEGTVPPAAASGQDAGYTALDLFGLADDALAAGATITLTADYTIMPHLSATAQNGRVDVVAAGETPSPGATSDSLDVTGAPPAGARIGFAPSSENWELPEDGITVRDQYGNVATLERSAGEKSVTLGGRTVTLELAFAGGGTSEGTLTVLDMPQGAEEGVVLSVTFSYRFTRIQSTFAEEAWLEQADGSYARLGEAATRPAQDAGSEAGVRVPEAPAGYLFSRVTYEDAAHDEGEGALPVRFDGSTVLRYYFDLVDYTVTLSSDVPASLPADGWSGPEGGPWTRTFTVLDEVGLPAPEPAAWTKGFLGWREPGASGDLASVPAGTTRSVELSARWRDLAVVGAPTVGEAPVYDATPLDIPLVAPAGYAWDGSSIVRPPDGASDGEPAAPAVAATASGTLSAVDAGGYVATFALADGFVWDGGSLEALDVAWEVLPADAGGSRVSAPRCIADGTPQRPSPTVVFEGRTLVAGRDYEVAWSDNVEPGVATVTVTFRGNYAGVASGTFEIESRHDAGRPMYRLYNPNSGEHFYTASAAERDAVAAAGWDYEGVGWVAPDAGEPVFRLYNAYGGDHHYTLSAEERDALVGAGWDYEGVGWQSDELLAVPVWREYNPYATSGAHNFTTSQDEHLGLCAIGWRGEGVAWYGV